MGQHADRNGPSGCAKLSGTTQTPLKCHPKMGWTWTVCPFR
jgi:hypothetical protein